MIGSIQPNKNYVMKSYRHVVDKDSPGGSTLSVSDHSPDHALWNISFIIWHVTKASNSGLEKIKCKFY